MLASIRDTAMIKRKFESATLSGLAGLRTGDPHFDDERQMVRGESREIVVRHFAGDDIQTGVNEDVVDTRGRHTTKERSLRRLALELLLSIVEAAAQSPVHPRGRQRV